MNTYPEKEKIAVVSRYLNGETISKISQTTKISRTTIYLWIKKRNNSFNKGKAPDFRYLHDLQEKCDRQQKIIEILQRSPCTPSAPLLFHLSSMIFRNRYDLFFLISDFEQILKPLCKFFFVDSVKNIVRVLPVVSQIPCRNPQIMRHKIFRQNV